MRTGYLQLLMQRPRVGHALREITGHAVVKRRSRFGEITGHDAVKYPSARFIGSALIFPILARLASASEVIDIPYKPDGLLCQYSVNKGVGVAQSLSELFCRVTGWVHFPVKQPLDWQQVL